MKKNLFSILTLFSLALILSCKSGPFNMLKSGSPHQQYERKLQNAGLDKTVMGATWISNAQASLTKAVAINLPYQEKGYFAADKIDAIAFRFNLTRGQKIQIQLDRKPVEKFMIYADLWELNEQQEFKLLTSADTLGKSIELDANKTGTYVLRLQPELLGSGEYTLAITTGPSLGYPLKAVNKNQIQSLFGVGRDAGARKHEGVDIFSSFRTPVLAVANGRVTRVNTNNLGGKVVWFRPNDKDYTLYYAHLDEQLVTDGQTVFQGDTLGLMGNTGNAQTTPPHLHLGLYTNGGAIDPLPFIDPTVQKAPPVTSSVSQLNATLRTTSKVELDGVSLKSGNVIRVNAASKNNYRVELPDGSLGYIPANKLVLANKPLTTYKTKIQSQIYDKPDSLASVKVSAPSGEFLDVLGSFKNYQLVKYKNQVGWVLND
ncbi:M23 family metallopeptidase [Pedobacter namyangjuensis]|uniref:M23 family metallopeptidase n=1 Tax=Pedobacter namyangjuensis TaxID=600626 RepID=UPI000DE41E5A|nr:M23 family metallopeptidase [Pedobacter namyangjuensis]